MREIPSDRLLWLLLAALVPIMKNITISTKKSSASIAATPIKKPTRSSVAFPPKTIVAPSPVNPTTKNIDQIAANAALL